MSITVAPLPSGLGVSAVNEHRARRDPDAHHPPDDEPAADDREPGGEAHSRRSPRHEAAPLAADEPPVPAETLFATALLASSLVPRVPSPAEMQLRADHGWQPPESSLRLKDKLI